MDITRAVRERRSVRAFLPDPIPRQRIREIIEMARWAPSWGNTQPWEILVVDGDRTRQLGEAFVDAANQGRPPKPDIDIPGEFPARHLGRYKSLGKALFSTMGIQRGDADARLKHYLNMYRFFGAPTVVYFLIDGGLPVPYACLDIGSIGTTFCHVAYSCGLGTIFLAASIHYPDIIRSMCGVEEKQKFVIGIAVGTPNPDVPAGIFRSERLPVEQLVQFV